MRVKDIMTAEVLAVTPDTSVQAIAEQLLTHRISGVPVVDAEHRVLGIVSEGDLLRRPESETDYSRSWWLKWFAGSREDAAEFLKTHGLRAEQVMTRDVVTVTEDTSLAEAARILEKRHIKRVPVVRDGRLVGIVSRANLLHGLAAQQPVPAASAPDDRALREQIMAVIEGHGWPSFGSVNVIVSNGRVELWGLAKSAEELQALQLAAERVAGADKVDNHVGIATAHTLAE